MKSYLDILERIIKEGKVRNNRTLLDTLTASPIFWEHSDVEWLNYVCEPKISAEVAV